MIHVNDVLFPGPNRHGQQPVIESRFRLTKSEIKSISKNGELFRERLLTLLEECGVSAANTRPISVNFPRRARMRFAFLYAWTAIALQREAGHLVAFISLNAPPDKNRFNAVFEYEDEFSGRNAGEISLALLAQVIPEVEFEFKRAKAGATVKQIVSYYLKRSGSMVLPADTRALVEAAERKDIPWFKRDRPPYKNKMKKYRIRQQGALVLGHGVNQQLVDGTLSLTRCRHLKPLVENRHRMRQKLESLGVIMPVQSRAPKLCANLLDAISASNALGYPIAIKSVRRGQGKGVSARVNKLDELMNAVQQAQAVTRQFMVERHIEGAGYRIIMANHQVIAILTEQTLDDIKERTSESVLNLAIAISEELGAGMLVITVVTNNISESLELTGGAVVDVDVAPELDRYLPPDSVFLRQAADEFIRFSFPPGQPSRIPIVAVTGSTGVSAVGRIISLMAQRAGFNPGLTSSDGLYIDNKLFRAASYPQYGSRRYHLQLMSPKINYAVMEFPIDQLIHSGHVFDHCNVAVCTHVVPEKSKAGWEPPETFADLNRSVLRHARDGVVINVDDKQWRSLLNGLTAQKVCLTSRHHSLEKLRGFEILNACFCFIQTVSGHPHVVIHDEGQKMNVMPVVEIAAIDNCAGDFYIESALQATAAGYLMKLGLKEIRAVLSEGG